MPRPRTVSTVPEKERVCLVSVAVRGRDGALPVEDSLDELAHLASTAGAEVVLRFSQVLSRPSRTYLGQGKLEELADTVKSTGIDTVIFDDELEPSQQRALEDVLGVKVIDRSSLILDVFAARARTREGKLQTDLAQSEYLLPRLAGQWSHLERLGGGIGTRGPGESQIETDRRIVRSKIARLKRELERVREHRSQQRRNRARGEARIVNLVGYTNAGKSLLFNRLTDSAVIARHQLFSTLDPTTRRIFLPSGTPAVLTDTVGFIHKLPSIVVAAFRATLEELREADLLLHVIDISDPLAERHAEVVDRILAGLELSGIPRVLVLNKFDLVSDEPAVDPAGFAVRFGGRHRTVVTSAERTWGIDQLRQAIEQELQGGAEPDYPQFETERTAFGRESGDEEARPRAI